MKILTCARDISLTDVYIVVARYDAGKRRVGTYIGSGDLSLPLSAPRCTR